MQLDPNMRGTCKVNSSNPRCSAYITTTSLLLWLESKRFPEQEKSSVTSGKEMFVMHHKFKTLESNPFTISS